MRNREVKQGDIYYVNLGAGRGSIQGGYRPVIIYQNNIGNRYSPVVNCYCITKASNNKSKKVPTHVRIGREAGLKEESIIMIEQPVTVNKSDLREYVGRCTKETLREIWKASAIQHGKIKPKFDIGYITERINKIKDIDDFIKRYKYKYNISEELLDRSFLLAEIIIYCNNYNIDYEKILVQSNLIAEKHIKEMAV